MTDRFNPPEDIAFHERFYNGLTRGDITNVATLAGKHRSTLSKELNPEEPARSAPYQACVELEAWRVVNYAKFDELADMLTEFIVSRRVSSTAGDSADRQAVAAYCNQVISHLLKGSDEDEFRAAVRSLYAVAGEFLRPNLEEVRRKAPVASPEPEGRGFASGESGPRPSSAYLPKR